MKAEYVKLYTYEEHQDVTFIEGLEAKSFDDFLFVTVNADAQPHMINEMLRPIADAMPDKQLIVLPLGMELKFYGVKYEESDDS